MMEMDDEELKLDAKEAPLEAGDVAMLVLVEEVTNVKEGYVKKPVLVGVEQCWRDQIELDCIRLIDRRFQK